MLEIICEGRCIFKKMNLIFYNISDFNVDVLQDEEALALNNNIEENCITQCIRCSVHTFQLYVESGHKELSIQKILTKILKVNILKL